LTALTPATVLVGGEEYFRETEFGKNGKREVVIEGG